MLTFPSDDSDNERSNVPDKVEPPDNESVFSTVSVCDLTMEQQFILSRFKLELRGRDKDLVEIIGLLQRQVFGMQNFMKSELVPKMM